MGAIKRCDSFQDYILFFRQTVSTAKKLNVIVIGLDSVSRMNFHRQMPKTRTFLDKKLNAIEFFGFNKIGDNTFPNLMATLTGLSVQELQTSCLKTNLSRFDNCTFIWEKFHNNGYVTGFAEEYGYYGVFTYNTQGFLHVPMMHYLLPFSLEVEHEISRNRNYIKKCNTLKPTLQYFMEYSTKFIQTYHEAKKKFFGIFWECEITHESFNYDPNFDNYYQKHLSELKSSGVLNDSILFFISDHGARFGLIMDSYQGRFEERLPLLYVILPDWFKKKYPQVIMNLKGNSRKLTTPYDIHETLKAIIDEDYSTDPIFRRGISLFRSIPSNRTCSVAGISIHLCTCHTFVPVNVKNLTVIYAAQYVLTHIRTLLKGRSECASLVLAKISSATALDDGFVKRQTKKNHYSVVFQTQPGGGVFEATVGCGNCFDDFEMAGPISRHNLYKYQCGCIDDAVLKMYCFCK